METKTCFLNLFQRGRYRTVRAWHEENETLAKHQMEQRERFCVAAFVFALEYDERFRDRFVATICPSFKSKVEAIRDEMRQCADLSLEANDSVLVVEFKMGAEFRDWQNPSKDAFWNGGYGTTLPRVFPAKKRYFYVVLGEAVGKPLHNDIACYERKWADLLPLAAEFENGLVRDLFESIARLGLPIFFLAYMKSKNLAPEAEAGMQVYDALTGVMNKAGIEKGRSDSGDGCIGFSIRSGSFSSPHLAQRQHGIGWIGYERVTGRQRSCCIYFYSTDAGALEIERCLRRRCAKLALVELAGAEVILRPVDEYIKEDTDWFGEILEEAKVALSDSTRKARDHPV